MKSGEGIKIFKQKNFIFDKIFVYFKKNIYKAALQGKEKLHKTF
jgi:hypothetical protein